MKICKDGIFWRRWQYVSPEQQKKADDYSKGDPFLDYECYITWPSWIPKDIRHWGHHVLPYDGQVHEVYGFWFFDIGWSTLASYKKGWR